MLCLYINLQSTNYLKKFCRISIEQPFNTVCSRPRSELILSVVKFLLQCGHLLSPDEFFQPPFLKEKKR